MTMTKNKLYHMVLAGILCAIGIVVPMFMPRIVLGPMSFTLASHVAVFLGMFISPAVAVAVCIGTTIGFFLTTPAIIALRAASHIVFAFIGAAYLKRNPDIINRPVASIVFNFIIALLHAAAEMIIVTPFFISGALFTAEQLANGFVASVVLLVGLGTVIHSMLDYSISILVWKPLCTCNAAAAYLAGLNPLKEKPPKFRRFFCAYFTSQPPHSTTVKPLRSNDANVCGSMVCALCSGFHAMNTRRTLSGVGSMSSLAASVYASDWNEMRLYGLSCIFGSQYTMNSLYSRGVKPISASFSRRKSAVSAPATQKPCGEVVVGVVLALPEQVGVFVAVLIVQRAVRLGGDSASRSRRPDTSR